MSDKEQFIESSAPPKVYWCPPGEDGPIIDMESSQGQAFMIEWYRRKNGWVEEVKEESSQPWILVVLAYNQDGDLVAMTSHEFTSESNCKRAAESLGQYAITRCFVK